MGLFGKLASGIARFGGLAQQALRPLSGIVQPIANAIGATAGAFLPAAAANMVSGVANKVADFVQSGRAADIAGRIGGAGMALTGAMGRGMPQNQG